MATLHDRSLIAILATDGFDERQLTLPLQQLRGTDLTVEVLSIHNGEIRGFNGLERSPNGIKVDRTLDNALATPDRYAGLLIPGGLLSIDTLRGDRLAVQFVRGFAGLDRPLALVGHAASLLISAGIAEAHRLAGPPSIEADLRNAGAIYAGTGLTTDGHWSSCADPELLTDFFAQSIAAFSEAQPMISEDARNAVWRARMI